MTFNLPTPLSLPPSGNKWTIAGWAEGKENRNWLLNNLYQQCSASHFELSPAAMNSYLLQVQTRCRHRIVHIYPHKTQHRQYTNTFQKCLRHISIRFLPWDEMEDTGTEVSKPTDSSSPVKRSDSEISFHLTPTNRRYSNLSARQALQDQAPQRLQQSPNTLTGKQSG